MADRELKVKFTGDTKSLSSATKTAGKQVKGFGDLAGKVGGHLKHLALGLAGVGVAAGGIGVAFGVDAVKAASDVNESMSKVDTVFGDAGKTVKKFSDTSAESFGISRAATLDAAGAFGSLFTGLKIAKPQAAAMSDRMIRLAADLASFNNEDPSDVLESMSGAFRGEYDSLQRVIPQINAASVEQRALADSHKKSASQLTASDKAMAAYALMIEDAGVANGDFARTSDGLANRQRILSARFDDLKTSIGQKLLPWVIKLGEWVQDHLIPALETWGRKLWDDVKPKLQQLQGWIKDKLIPALQDLAAWIGDHVGTAWDGFMAWWDEQGRDLVADCWHWLEEKLFPAIKGFAEWAGKNSSWSAPIAAGITAIAVAIGLLGIGMLTNPFGLVILGVIGVAAAFGYLYATQPGVRQWISDMKSNFSSFAMYLAGTMSDMRGFLVGAWVGVSGVIGPWVNAYIQMHVVLWDVLRRGWGAYRTFLDFNRAAIKGVLSLMSGDLGGVKQAIRDMKSAVEDLVGWTLANVPLLGVAFFGTYAVIASAIEAIVKLIGSIPDRIRGAITSAKNLIGDLAGMLLGLNLPGGGGGGFNIPVDIWPFATGTVPGLAGGGIVRASPHGTLALLAEGGRDEAVVPLPARTAPARTYNLNVAVSPAADPARVGRDIVRAIQRWESVGGTTWRAG